MVERLSMSSFAMKAEKALNLILTSPFVLHAASVNPCYNEVPIAGQAALFHLISLHNL